MADKPSLFEIMEYRSRRIHHLETKLAQEGLRVIELETHQDALVQESVRLAEQLATAERERDALKLEARIQAQEAHSQKATVHACYEIVTGKTGEPGDWNGAEPVRAYVSALRNELAEARRLAQWTPITPDNLPIPWKSEILCFGGHVEMAQDVENTFMRHMELGHTHYRSINAPTQKEG